MYRRRFLKIGSGLFAAPLLSGMGNRAFGSMGLGEQGQADINALAKLAAQTDRVLVIVRMDGGNDGLNTVIPLDQYPNLTKARGNILIPEASVLKLNAATGLHPSMPGFYKMFNEGKLRIVQSVGYPNHNQSHFRSTDIWFTGSDSNQILSTGWLGRYLDGIFPNYPEGYPNTNFPDPPAVQIGSSLYTLLQGPTVPLGMAVSNPTSIYSLTPAGTDTAPNTPAGHELTFIRLIATETQKYGVSLKKAFANAPANKSNLYPATGNKLSDQLKAVARLIAGGLQTKIFVVSQGGFDTHSNQVDGPGSDTLTGNHANLLSMLDTAISAFQDDLKLLGLENRVMGATISEFGRRILSNASSGTDHGTSAPLFVWGGNVSGGILGNNPNIADTVTVRDNVPMQYDFRSVYTSLLTDWMGVSSTDLKKILLKDFTNLPIINTAIRAPGESTFSPAMELEQNYPNPFRSATTLRYAIKTKERVRLKLIDSRGNLVRVLTDSFQEPGSYHKTLSSEGLAPGAYIYQLEVGGKSQQRLMELIR